MLSFCCPFFLARNQKECLSLLSAATSHMFVFGQSLLVIVAHQEYQAGIRYCRRSSILEVLFQPFATFGDRVNAQLAVNK